MGSFSSMWVCIQMNERMNEEWIKQEKNIVWFRSSVTQQTGCWGGGGCNFDKLPRIEKLQHLSVSTPFSERERESTATVSHPYYYIVLLKSYSLPYCFFKGFYKKIFLFKYIIHHRLNLPKKHFLLSIVNEKSGITSLGHVACLRLLEILYTSASEANWKPVPTPMIYTIKGMPPWNAIDISFGLLACFCIFVHGKLKKYVELRLQYCS